MMKISDFGLAFIADEEAFVDHVYEDQVGRNTIGIGHLIKPGEVFGVRISHADALALFRADLAHFEAAVNACISCPLTQKQFDVIVSLAFNIGAAGLAKSEFRRKLNAGNIGTSCDEDGHRIYTGAMREWSEFRMGMVDGDLTIIPALVRRRAKEIEIFLADVTDSGPAAA